MTLGKTNTVIGIIEDDVLLNQALNIALKNTGYSTICMYTKKDALSLIKDKVELLIIDIGLPDGNGIYLYQELQKKRKIPAIFLTARDEEKDMLEAFDIGADDYVVKPFSVKVLLKRIEVVLKRNEEEIISFGDLTLYLDRKQVFLYGQEILLTVKEYQLLEYLMVNGQFVVDNTVSVTINRLRKKIEPDAKQPIYIKNVYGLGYRIGEK